jgi:hypothetical protein
LHVGSSGTQAPPEQLPPQHDALEVHAWPSEMHGGRLHRPPAQVPAQQSAGVAQAKPKPAQPPAPLLPLHVLLLVATTLVAAPPLLEAIAVTPPWPPVPALPVLPTDALTRTRSAHAAHAPAASSAGTAHRSGAGRVMGGGSRWSCLGPTLYAPQDPLGGLLAILVD